MLKINVVLIATLLLYGCVTVGQKFDDSKVSQIQKGVTTKEEVVALIGKPSGITLDEDGKTIMLYQYTKVNTRASSFIPVVSLFSSGMDTDQRTLQIYLENNKVEKYFYTSNSMPVNTGILNTQ